MIGSNLKKTKLIDFGLAVKNNKKAIMDFEHLGTILY